MLTQNASVLICYNNFAARKNISHVGLGVSALNIKKVLRSLGLKVDLHPILNVSSLRIHLERTPRTHVVIFAPYLPTSDLASLIEDFPDTSFFVNCHSNVGFLQVDPSGVRLFREEMELQAGSHNFRVSGNSLRFAQWVREAFGIDCAWLPNLYYLDSHTPVRHRHEENSCTLRMGIFGAARPQKNILSAAGAALEIARDLRRPLRLWLSSGRSENGGGGIAGSVSALLDGLPGVSIEFAGWLAWPRFRRLVGTMHLLLQTSYTESFNMVTADGVAEGVPSVVSNAIEWAPAYWKADADDVHSIAMTGLRVLHHHHAAQDGYHALVEHNTKGVRAWARAFGLEDLPPYDKGLRSQGSHRYEAA